MNNQPSPVPCPHLRHWADLADWVVTCRECGAVLRNLDEDEGNQLFNRLMEVQP